MALGAEVWVEEFALDRVDPVECFVEFGVRQIAAVPVFDTPSTDPAGISGRLGAIGSEAEIGVAELSPRAVYSGEFERLRRDGPHRALVILCAGERPGMGLLNAEQFRNPYGPPALHVASTERPQDCPLLEKCQCVNRPRFAALVCRPFHGQLNRLFGGRCVS